MSRKRSFKIDKLARIYDAEVLPIWSERFGRMLLRGLKVPDRGQVLDVACGTGYPAVEILRRMGPGCRLIAIDGASALLDVARKKIGEIDGAKNKVFFRTESAEPKLSFADDVYDLVVCNLGLEEIQDQAKAVADFARVTVPGGEVRCTLPLSGTFEQFYDIYREVLTKHDKHEALDRLNEHAARLPTVETCEQWMNDAGFAEFSVEISEFSMLFKTSREFFFAPIIEYGPLAEWKAIAGSGQEMQDVFWYIKEAIDAYFGGRAFQVTVNAGCLIGRVRREDDDEVTGRVERIGDLTSHEAESEGIAAGGSVDIDGIGEVADASDLIVSEVASEVLSERTGEDAPRECGRAGTEELDIGEIEEMEFETLEAADDDEVDVVLDAFLEGSERPEHLDE